MKTDQTKVFFRYEENGTITAIAKLDQLVNNLNKN